MQVYVLSSHYKSTALVVVHAQEDLSFVVQMDFQSLHYFLVLEILDFGLEFLDFGLELFLMFVHLRVHDVHIPIF